MKKQHLFSYAIILLSLFQSPIFAQLKHLHDVKILPNHPRILLLQGEEKTFKKVLRVIKTGQKYIKQLLLKVIK